jgi:uncharacterized cupredoxin-like copper-binding protein
MNIVLSLLVSLATVGGPLSPPHRVAPPLTPVVTVHASEFAYTGPKTIKSGVTLFRLINDGNELHHLIIVKLDKGKTMADFIAAMKKPGPPPSWTTFEGGPNPALPHATVDATLSLEPGDYVLLCTIPSPGERAPHAVKGMVGALTVSAEKNGALEPVTDQTIRLNDYSFAMPATLAAGHHNFQVVNDAQQLHEVVVVELPPGETIADLGNWVDKSLMKGPPPGRPVGGMAPLSTGRTGVFSVDLKPGTYGLICLVPDAKNGTSHFQHGMTKTLTVR